MYGSTSCGMGRILALSSRMMDAACRSQDCEMLCAWAAAIPAKRALLMISADLVLD